MRCCVVGIVFLLACSADEPAVERAALASARPAVVAAAPARPTLPDTEPDVEPSDDDEIWDVTDDPDTEDIEHTEDDTEDADHDHHALIDQDDRCPEDPADWDGYEDDGCPEPAAIAVHRDFGIPWQRTATGFEASYQSADSTVELVMRDRDHDLATDEVDPCPDQPEDIDGWQDDDGCPDPDVGGEIVVIEAD